MHVHAIQTPALMMESLLKRSHDLVEELKKVPNPEQIGCAVRIRTAEACIRQLSAVWTCEQGMTELMALFAQWNFEVGRIDKGWEIANRKHAAERGPVTFTADGGKHDALQRMSQLLLDHLVKLHTYYADTIAKAESLARWVGEIIVQERESRQQLEQRFGDLEQHLGDLNLPD